MSVKDREALRVAYSKRQKRRRSLAHRGVCPDHGKPRPSAQARRALSRRRRVFASLLPSSVLLYMNYPNYWYNGYYYNLQQPPARVPGHWGAYLAGARPDPPPPRAEEVAAAHTLAMLGNNHVPSQVPMQPARDAVDGPERPENAPAYGRGRSDRWGQCERPGMCCISPEVCVLT